MMEGGAWLRLSVIIVGMLTPTVHSQCHQLTLTEADTHKHLMGDYRYFCDTQAGHPIYKHKLKGAYLYHVARNTTAYWIVGPVIEGSYAYLKVNDSTVNPAKIKNKWDAWSTDEGRWIPDRSKFHCTECKSVSINGTGAPSAVRGVYYIQSIFRNLRPVYKHQSKELFLYFSACRKWVVGPKVGQNIGAMYARANASVPWEISTSWTVFSPTSQTDTKHVTIKCADSDPRAFKPKSFLGCGKPKVSLSGATEYILKGSEVEPRGKWPWMVAVVRPDRGLRCGGVLIGSRWVLTAGHCTSGNGPSKDTVLVGAHNLNVREEHRQFYDIRRSYRHPNYSWSDNPFRVDKDLAVLELEEEVKFTDYVQPVCLPTGPTADYVNGRERCAMIGWGAKDYRTPAGGVLRELFGSVVDARTCAATRLTMLKSWLPDTSSLCVIPSNYGKICMGDSGGPLLCQRNGRWHAVGIASWVIVACLPTNLPSVFMDVSRDVKWIRDICQC